MVHYKRICSFCFVHWPSWGHQLEGFHVGVLFDNPSWAQLSPAFWPCCQDPRQVHETTLNPSDGPIHQLNTTEWPLSMPRGTEGSPSWRPCPDSWLMKSRDIKKAALPATFGVIRYLAVGTWEVWLMSLLSWWNLGGSKDRPWWEAWRALRPVEE